MAPGTTKPIVIRSASESDVSQLAALIEQAERLHARLVPGLFRAPPQKGATPSPSTGTGERRLRSLLSLQRTDVLYLVAERVGQLVGLVHAEIHAPPVEPWMTPLVRCQVHEIIVASRYRRRGIGRNLMSAATSWARSQGAKQMLLTVWEGNEAAQAFYRSSGFCNVSVAMMCPL